MKVYTKQGDDGSTGLIGGARVQKDDVRIESYGTVDELNSFIGLLQAKLLGSNELEEVREELRIIQVRLFDLGALLASQDPESLNLRNRFETLMLEEAMDRMDLNLAPLKHFVLPAGSEAVSLAHVCRTITRRAERQTVSLNRLENDEYSTELKWLNRLSDYFFVLSRYIAQMEGVDELKWRAHE